MLFEEIKMSQPYNIVPIEKPEDTAWGFIGKNLNRYNAEHAGEINSQILCFGVQGPEKDILGGIVAIIHWNWLFIDLMWLQENLRGKGYGSRLLMRVEEEARQRGATHAHLDTFSFQAPNFYKRHGYQVFGELRDFPPGHQRYFLTKQL